MPKPMTKLDALRWESGGDDSEVDVVSQPGCAFRDPQHIARDDAECDEFLGRKFHPESMGMHYDSYHGYCRDDV